MRRAATKKAEATTEWGRRRLLGILAAAVAVAVLLLVGLVYAVYLAIAGIGDEANANTGVATGDLIAPMMSLVAKGGRGVVTAVAPISQEDVKLNLFDLAMQRKELVGCIFGNANPRRDIPRLLRLYDEGRLKLDELVSKRITLADVNAAFADMERGDVARSVIVF